MKLANLSKHQELTDSPIQVGRFTAPEFLDAEGVEGYFGLKRSVLYRLLAENRVRAVSIRQHGRTRGKRLFDVSAIRDFLNSNVDKEVVIR